MNDRNDLGTDFPVDGATDPFLGALIHGLSILRTHGPDRCEGQVCAVHNPSDHHMRKWRLIWRADRQILERICPHGIGHPDPDQFQYWAESGQEWQSVHGCDRCCIPPEGSKT